jgi:hypothetical protein
MNSCNVRHSYSANLTTATPLEKGAANTNSAGEEQTDLLCATQGASVQVQRQPRLFCHLHYNKSEEHNNNNNMDSSDYENSYVPLCVFAPDEELDGLTNNHDKLNTLDNTQKCLSNSHHKTAFDDEESSLATSGVSLSDDSSSQQKVSIAFGYYCCEIEADEP